MTVPEAVLFQGVTLIWNEKVFFAVDGEVVLPIDQTRRHYLQFLEAYFGKEPIDLHAPQWREAGNHAARSSLKIFNR